MAAPILHVTPGGPAGQRLGANGTRCLTFNVARRSHPPFPNAAAIESGSQSISPRIRRDCKLKVELLVAARPSQKWPGHPRRIHPPFSLLTAHLLSRYAEPNGIIQFLLGIGDCTTPSALALLSSVIPGCAHFVRDPGLRWVTPLA